MAIYRQIQTLFWQDGFVAELTPEEKYFYVYLLTNSRTTQCGIFEINIRIMEAETGYNRETLEKLIKRFEEYGKLLYCNDTKEIIMLNWMKYNFINSKNTICCINKELKLVKNKSFINLLYKKCLSGGHNVEAIFKDIVLDTLEEKVDEEVNTDVKEDDIDSLDEETEPKDSACKGLDSENNIEKDGLEGASKDLGEKEEQKEKQKEEENKKNGAEAFCSCKDLLEFNKNIEQATEGDLEKLAAWRQDFEEEVIIQAIYEAVKYNAKHARYIDSVLKRWKSEGVRTLEELQGYRGGSCKKVDKCNADAYRYLD